MIVFHVQILIEKKRQLSFSYIHVSCSYISHSFLLQGEEPPAYIIFHEMSYLLIVILLNIIMLLFHSDLVDIKEWHFDA